MIGRVLSMEVAVANNPKRVMSRRVIVAVVVLAFLLPLAAVSTSSLPFSPSGLEGPVAILLSLVSLACLAALVITYVHRRRARRRQTERA